MNDGERQYMETFETMVRGWGFAVRRRMLTERNVQWDIDDGRGGCAIGVNLDAAPPMTALLSHLDYALRDSRPLPEPLAAPDLCPACGAYWQCECPQQPSTVGVASAFITAADMLEAAAAQRRT